jgi:hypothetical protein
MFRTEEHRTICGTLVLTRNEGAGRVDGSLRVASESKIDFPTTSNDFDREGAFSSRHLRYERVDTHPDVNISGYILMIDERVALPWMLRESPQGDDEVVRLSSTDEADALVAQHRELGVFERSWIHNHLDVPNLVAEKIYDFVTWKRPDPALFFEKGDLWVRVDYEEAHWSTVSWFDVRRRV